MVWLSNIRERRVKGVPVSKNLKNNNNTNEILPDTILTKVEDYVSKNVGIPELGVNEADFSDDIVLSNLSNCTNDQLEEYLSLYGSYKSFLESQLSRAESRRGLLRGMFEDTLSKEQYSLSLQYDKRQTKDFLRGEAMLNNKYLDDLHNDLLESDALCVRISGMKDSYSSGFATVSRVVSLRISGREQV